MHILQKEVFCFVTFLLNFAEMKGTSIWGCEDREMEKEVYFSPFLWHPCLSVVCKPAKFN